MGTLQLKKVQPGYVATSKQDLLAIKVDQYGACAVKIREATKDLKVYKDEIIGLQGVEGKSKTNDVLKGKTHEIDIQKSRNEVVVHDRDRLKELLGQALFDSIWSVGVTLLRAHLTARQLEEISHIELGSRTWKVKKL